MKVRGIDYQLEEHQEKVEAIMKIVDINRKEASEFVQKHSSDVVASVELDSRESKMLFAILNNLWDHYRIGGQPELTGEQARFLIDLIGGLAKIQ